MGSIIDKLKRTKSVIESLCTQLNSTVSDSYKCYSLKDIESHMSKIHMLTMSTTASSSNVRSGKTFYKTDGSIYQGTWKPYSGSTVTASDILSGVKAYDVDGNLITGTHTCSSGSSTDTGFTLTLVNSSSSIRLITGFTGSNNALTPSFVDVGNTYTFPNKINLGDMIHIVVAVKRSAVSTPTSPRFNVSCPIVIFRTLTQADAYMNNSCIGGATMNNNLGIDVSNEYYLYAFVGTCFYQLSSGSYTINVI